MVGCAYVEPEDAVGNCANCQLTEIFLLSAVN